MMKYSTQSIPGVDKENEDAFAVWQSDDLLIAVVADGMGGRSHGALAAKTVTSSVCLELQHTLNQECDIPTVIRKAIVKADDSLAELSQEYRSRMGCALGCVVVDADSIYYVGVGDIRLYLHKSEGNFVQMSTDDALTGGNGKTYLTKSICGRGVPQYTLLQFPRRDYDKVRLCSDGYYSNNLLDDSTVIDVEL